MMAISMRLMLVAALLLASSCRVSPNIPLVTVPVAAPTVDSGAYTYWYSADQREILDYLEKPRTFVNIDGKLVEYTECVHAAQNVPFGRWNDYKLIGTIQASCTPF